MDKEKVISILNSQKFEDAICSIFDCDYDHVGCGECEAVKFMDFITKAVKAYNPRTERKYTCCICGEEHTGWGNNPWPLDGDICCDRTDGVIAWKEMEVFNG